MAESRNITSSTKIIHLTHLKLSDYQAWIMQCEATLRFTNAEILVLGKEKRSEETDSNSKDVKSRDRRHRLTKEASSKLNVVDLVKVKSVGQGVLEIWKRLFSEYDHVMNVKYLKTENDVDLESQSTSIHDEC